MLRFALMLSALVYLSSVTTYAAEPKSLATPLKTRQFGGQTWGNYKLPNGMEVLLISDPNMKKASAALTVAAGSWSNPKEYPGIAHFLEHMLFLGTRSFPVAGEYQDFIQNHGGSENAGTSEDHTTYQFDVDAEAMTGALTRFSKFFSEPLFTPEFVDREKNAVHHEYQKDIPQELYRLSLIVEQLTPENHPAHVLSVGTLDTLAPVDRNTLISFYEKHYSANIMKLAVMTPGSIESMKTLVDPLFSIVPNRNLDNGYKKLPPYWRAGTWTDIKSLIDVDQLTLTFPMPSSNTEAESSPQYFICAVLGSENPGSAAYALKNQHLVTSLECGNEDNDPYGSISLTLRLTKDGANRIPDILHTVFSSVDTAKKAGLQRYTFDEKNTLATYMLQHRQVEEGADWAVKYAEGMLEAPAFQMLEDLYTTRKFDPALYLRDLSLINPQNVSVVRLFPEAETDREEPYFKIQYAVHPLSTEQLAQMTPIADATLHYPEPNQHIAMNFDIYKDEAGTTPVAITKSAQGTLYFQQEGQSKISEPRAYLTMLIYSEELAKSPRNQLLGRAYSGLLQRRIARAMQPWTDAGYEAGITAESSTYIHMAGHNSVQIGLAGFSDHFGVALQDFLTQLTPATFTDEDVNDMLEQVKANFANLDKASGLSQAMQERSGLFNPFFVSVEEQKKIVATITRQEIESFGKELFKSIYIKGVVSGNVRSADFKSLYDQVYSTLGAQPMSTAAFQALQLPHTRIQPGHFAKMISGADNNNGYVTSYQGGPYNLKNDAIGRIVALELTSPYYAELRTHQQLGYIVSSQYEYDESQTLQSFYIQSDHDVRQVARSSQEFLKKYTETLTRQSKPTLEQAKTAIANGLLPQLDFVQMKDRHMRIYSDMLNHGADFAFFAKAIQAVKSVTLADVSEYLKTTFGPQQGQLTVYYTNRSAPAVAPLPEEQIVESKDDLKEYKVRATEARE